ncbi:hypothetical protein D9613_008312 [Agrocybe pediades]|uniref:Uncharacterized protein n=1 Tax=Agrocybe pediades TaxID=84607 RepID=A0A8H4QSR2_9AGAR|nr:hypothetical protein D9613_008312 [Agrocybe pediades]
MAGGNKRRRVDASSRTLRSQDGQKQGLPRLNELIAEAIEVAKTLEPGLTDRVLIKEAHTLTDSLRKVLPLVRSEVKYEEYKMSLRQNLKKLQKICEGYYWADSYETQGELMSDISVRMNEWLAHVWLCMQEGDTVDMNGVEKALVLCSETVDDIKGCHMRWVYARMVGVYGLSTNPTTVVDVNGKVVYEEEYGSMKHNLAWMWRKLLVTSTSRNLPTQTILQNVKRFELVQEICKLLRRSEEEDDEEDEEEDAEEGNAGDENDDGYGFWDGHWTVAMKAAADHVISRLDPSR